MSFIFTQNVVLVDRTTVICYVDPTNAYSALSSPRRQKLASEIAKEFGLAIRKQAAKHAAARWIATVAVFTPTIIIMTCTVIIKLKPNFVRHALMTKLIKAINEIKTDNRF